MPDECPTREQLHNFLIGKVSSEEQLKIAEYVNHHPHALDEIAENDNSDPFIYVLQEPICDFASEPAFRRGLEKARSIRLREIQEAFPSRVGSFVLLERIACKSTSAVYKARDERTGQSVALKVLLVERIHDPAIIDRFQREMRAIEKLSHASIVRYIEAGEADGVLYLAMELLHGFDLSQLVARVGPLPIGAACFVGRQAALALQHAFENGLIHRDVKPSNIFVTAEGDVKLLDLGLARPVMDDEESLTRSDQLLGTLDYMAPEQAFDSRHADIRSDIYSLGCTLYKLLVGNAPFTSVEYRHPLKKLLAHSSHELPPVTAHRREIPTELAAIVECMCAKLPDDRIQSPAEVAEALSPYTSHEALKALAASFPVTPHVAAVADEPEPPHRLLQKAAKTGSGAVVVSQNRLPAVRRNTVIVVAVLATTLIACGVWATRHNQQRSVIVDTAANTPVSESIGVLESTGTRASSRASVPPPTSDDPEKIAARTIIERGGFVWIAGRNRPLIQTSELGANDITVTRIELQKLPLSTKEMEPIGKLQGLETVRLSGVGLRDEGVQYLCQNKNLTTLWLFDNPISDVSMQAIAELDELRSLNINNTRVTDISDLASLQNLQSLYIAFLRLDDADLEVLTQLPKLELLHLHATPITDASISSLEQLHGLRELGIPGTHISQQGFERLKRALPDCQILRGR